MGTNWSFPLNGTKPGRLCCTPRISDTKPHNLTTLSYLICKQLTKRISIRSTHLRTSGLSSVSALYTAIRAIMTAAHSWSKPAPMWWILAVASAQLRATVVTLIRLCPLECYKLHASTNCQLSKLNGVTHLILSDELNTPSTTLRYGGRVLIDHFEK